MMRPSNAKLILRNFNSQLTNWYELNDLENIIKDFRKDDYGKHFVIKRNKSNRKYAIFTKRASKKIIEERKPIREPYFFIILRRKNYMLKHLPKIKALKNISQYAL